MVGCNIMLRFLDIILSLFALILFFPFFILISFLLLCTGERKVFFQQARVGRGKKLFKLLKFATMLEDSPNLPGGDITAGYDPRVLPLGRILRKTKVNELPQLINILKGELSIVGPRPLTPRNFAMYSQEIQETITKVKPGLSGVGSIIFRDEESIIHNSPQSPEKYYKEHIIPYKGELEKWFSQNKSSYLYFSLIFITAWVVFFPKSGIVWNVFPSLPSPSDKLKEQLNFPMD